MSERRVFLFLQGPPSRFWYELAEALDAAGHKTLRVNLSAGDWLYWRKRGAINYRGSFKAWRSWLEALIEREGVTDILYYADRLPYHVVANEIARQRGIYVTAVEFGYLRPDWITVERDGMSTYSHFPNDPEIIRRIADHAPDPDFEIKYPYTFFQEASNEVIYNLASLFLSWMSFPRYHADKYYNPLKDYLSTLWRLIRDRWQRKYAKRVMREVILGPRPFYIFALQLQSDYQIRDNSPYSRLHEAIDQTIASFARNAPLGTVLVFKVHPLDNGLERWQKVVMASARRHDVRPRVRVIDGGNLNRLVETALGTILVNSTVGLYAIRAGCPLMVLGVAVFDIPGLTFQGTLDEFWTEAEPPDEELRLKFIRALAATTQVKGSFYNREGRKVAIAEMVRRLEARTVNEPGAFIDPPPRLEKARRLGMRV
ncbi:capsule biosynthesis protein [Prosthecomicrobium sp. N25]|uniref:capsule biosynthesis protein n=1 Tax=Prosthecomicrobium sp. N25 TaxID=3129254 RepID=UPI00307747AC